MGYVGLPLGVAFCEAGQEVVGVDTDARVVEALGRGESHVEDVPADSLRAVSDRFQVSTRLVGSSGVGALGREGREEILPAASPDSSSRGTKRSRVVPG